MGRLLIQFPGSTNAKVSNETLPKNTIVIDEENKQLRLHDGVTRGGFPIGDRGGAAPATTDLDNLTMTGRNIGNWSTNVSNCITEIPQDIKLELSSDGVLTLKGGSKVYKPNGVGVFDEFIINADKSFSGTDSSTYKALVFYDGSTAITICSLGECASGTSLPSSFSGVFYNTTTNKINFYTSDIKTGPDYYLPVGIVTMSGASGITSIDQVFNGFGYIGSTVFALPGVKGLIPNGRNADGTLKSTAFTVSSVLITTDSSTATGGLEYYLSGNEIFRLNIGNYEYKPDINYVWENNTNTSRGVMLLDPSAYRDSGKVSSFNPKQPFHAADSADVKFIINTVFQKVSALPSSPDPDTWYAIPE